MAYVCTGKLLRVDLTAGHWEVQEIGDEMIREYLLGSGLAARLFYDEMDPQRDALHPDSPLYFMTGLLTGTLAPTGCRSSVCGRSPLTGIWNESNVGGYWGAELRFAGFDGVVVSGRADAPVYLWIHDGTVELHPAGELWGLDCFELREQLRAATGPRAEIACVGPAGENGARLASVIFIGRLERAAGRGGMGAAMAAKNLKAIAVRGTSRPEYADAAALRAQVKNDNAAIREESVSLSLLGTAGGVPATEATGDLPIKNWLLGSWPEGAQTTSGQHMFEVYPPQHTHCFSCPIGCGKNIEIQAGPYAGVAGHAPEYETLGAFGAMLLNPDVTVIAKANELCNRYGLDTISTGSVIALAMEAHEKGLLSADQTVGLDLTWGNAEAIVTLVEQIARREGLGDLLADGVRVAAEQLGPEAEEMSIHVKGLALPMHDPRAFVDMAANYATANRGACHLESLSYWRGYGLEWPGWGYAGPYDRLDSTGKGRVAYDFQNYMSVFNPLGICKFIVKGRVEPATVARWVGLSTGWDLEADSLLLLGEKLFNLRRMINIRYGIGREDDTLPRRLLTMPRPSGAAQGILPDLEAMLEEYYQLRGWTADGTPSEEKLAELGLA
ncbi:MAG: aldehyde ferredoxin oxidoreductase family protein [Chloroflexota bacterium]|nr:aldehyde ferredoxin oxidoreductase family protein [Chloroflexota bacterium]